MNSNKSSRMLPKNQLMMQYVCLISALRLTFHRARYGRVTAMICSQGQIMTVRDDACVSTTCPMTHFSNVPDAAFHSGRLIRAQSILDRSRPQPHQSAQSRSSIQIIVHPVHNFFKIKHTYNRQIIK